MHFVYIMRCADGTLYTGYARDPAARAKVHNSGRGARYTAGRRPVSLVYSTAFDSRGEALKREHQIKQLSRAGKEALVAAGRDARKKRRRRRPQVAPHPFQDGPANGSASGDGFVHVPSVGPVTLPRSARPVRYSAIARRSPPLSARALVAHRSGGECVDDRLRRSSTQRIRRRGARVFAVMTGAAVTIEQRGAVGRLC